MTNAHRDLAAPELWTRSLDRSRRRRELLPKARRENNRRKHLSAVLATAVVAGPGAPLAAAQVSGDMSASIAASSPANRAIEIREGGLPLRVGSQGDLVAHVQTKLGVASDGVFGPQTDGAVRRYQLSAGLDVDGIVGPATWSSLFASEAGTGDAAIGGSNVPAAVKQEVAQRLEQAGAELAVDVGAPPTTAPTGPLSAPTPPAPTPPVPAPQPQTRQPNATQPVAQAPAGGSCSSATISTPVRGTVTSDFGPRGGRNHDGIDIAAPTGTPVRAAACGTVSLAGQQSGYGNIVCVTHTSQFSTCYAHLSRFGVSNGAQVKQGQVIGYVGCTGNCTGPHLHFETRVNGQAQNPRTYLSGGSIPGKRATVAGASSAGTTTSSTGTAEGTITGYGTGSTTATADPAVAESVQAAPAASAPAPPVPPAEVAPAESAPAEGAPAEGAPAEALAIEADTTAPTEVVAPVEVAPQPVAATETVAAETTTPALAAEPVAVGTEVAAPAEVAPEPAAAAVQVAAPAELAVQTAAPAVAASAADAGAAVADGAADQAQVDVAATAAVQ